MKNSNLKQEALDKFRSEIKASETLGSEPMTRSKLKKLAKDYQDIYPEISDLESYLLLNWDNKIIHDLRDYNVGVTDHEIVGSTPGSSGSWWEPAEAPEYEYEISGIEIDEWSTYDNRPDIKVGDIIDVKIDFDISHTVYPRSARCEDDGVDITINTIYEDKMTVKKVEYSEKYDVLFLTVSGNSGVDYGDKPAQSFRGRE